MTKVVAVTGGKGGTGKSTFAILLANKLRATGEKVVLADLDVECPNDHLLLGLSLKKPFDFVFKNFPVLDKRKCRRCGLCARKCRLKAVFAPPGQYPVFLEDLCAGCGLCAHFCPYGAIKMKRKKIGALYQRKITANFYLVTGQTQAVIEESGPVVSKTRQAAARLAKEVGASYLLLDTAAGMHCGVIRALLDVDLVYAVTEPTPLGAHDLALILRLTRRLKRPTKVVINQADLGKSEPIEAIAKENKAEIKYRIPYSEKLIRAYSQGKLEKIDIL